MRLRRWIVVDYMRYAVPELGIEAGSRINPEPNTTRYFFKRCAQLTANLVNMKSRHPQYECRVEKIGERH